MNSIICDTPESINAFQLLSMKGALKLESLGMRHSSGRSVAKPIRAILKAAGKKAPTNKKELFTEFEAHLRTIGVLLASETSPESKV